MDWITDDVAIGNYIEAQDVEFLSRNGFRSVLSLDGTLSRWEPEDLGLDEVVVIPLKDGPGNRADVFIGAVENLIDLAESFPPVLVHCHAGRSRSVIVVAGYLMQSLRIRPHEAIALIRSKRETCIQSGLEELLYHL